jgi:hypothetical protein
MTKAKLVGFLLLACVAATLTAAAMPDRILAGDAISYRERMHELFQGQVPYLDFDFEHLPGAIVPMAAAWVLGGSMGLPQFAISLAVVSSVFLLLTGLALSDLERILERGLAWRWLVSVMPLLPFLVFRNDSWPVLLAVAAFWAASIRGRSGSLLAWAGVVTKFWPVTWAAVEWLRGRRYRAAFTALLGVAMLVLLRSDSVLRIQRPSGVHSETLASSVLGIVGTLTGTPLSLMETSALYLEAPWWAHLINFVPAVAVALMAFYFMGHEFDWRRAWLFVGTVVGATMIASPLLSTQFMAWLTPFAALKPTHAKVMGVINILSLAMILNYNRAVEGNLEWFVLALARNATLLGLLILMALQLRSMRDSDSSIQLMFARSDEG